MKTLEQKRYGVSQSAGGTQVIRMLDSAGEDQSHALVFDITGKSEWTFRDVGELGKDESGQQVRFDVLLGLVSADSNKYLVLGTGSKLVGEIAGHRVFKITETKVLPVFTRKYENSADYYLEALEYHLSYAPLYYSRTLDITHTFQRQTTSHSGEAMWSRADERFFWNRYPLGSIIDYRMSLSQELADKLDKFIQPVIFGLYEIRKAAINGNDFTYALISRRSRHRAGTRYMTRGIDKDGNVANFNETEQAVIIGSHDHQEPLDLTDSPRLDGPTGSSGSQPLQILSFVQTRGSVPVFWSEINCLKYTPRLEIDEPERALGPARHHFEQQTDVYGGTYCVNLVNQAGREKRVKDAYEKIIAAVNRAPTDGGEPLGVEYKYFDFHHEAKGIVWHLVEGLPEGLAGLVGKIEEYGYSHLEVTGSESPKVREVSKQTGTFRTNCMDCLDRTNVVQSLIAKLVLNNMLRQVGVISKEESISVDENFQLLFRNMWADNADVVSGAYSGTGALKTDITRTGTRTKAGAAQDGLNSVRRYVKNNFFDGFRQDSYHVFLKRVETGPEALGGDERSLQVRSVPYLFVAALFLLFVTISTRREPTAAVWPVQMLMVLSVAVAAAMGWFMLKEGEQFVRWPRLAARPRRYGDGK